MICAKGRVRSCILKESSLVMIRRIAHTSSSSNLTLSSTLYLSSFFVSNYPNRRLFSTTTTKSIGKTTDKVKALFRMKPVSQSEKLISENDTGPCTYESNSEIDDFLNENQQDSNTSNDLQQDNIIDKGYLVSPNNPITKYRTSFSETSKGKYTFSSLLDADFRPLRSIVTIKDIIIPELDLHPETKACPIEFHITNEFTSLIERTNFSTIPMILMYDKPWQREELYQLIEKNFNNGVFLTSLEFEKLIYYITKDKIYTYKLAKLYRKKYDIVAFSIPTIKTLIISSAYNNDYILFDKLFNSYLIVSDNITNEILNLALEVYIRSGNISTATQLFNRMVKSSEELDPSVLFSYMKKLRFNTRNVDLCYAGYRLWVSENRPVEEKADALLYRILKDWGNRKQMDWLMHSFAKRERLDSLEVLTVDLMERLKDDKQLTTFFETSEYEDWCLEVMEEGQRVLDEFHMPIMRLLIKKGQFDTAKDILLESPCRRTLYWRTAPFIEHFKKSERSDILFSFLVKLKDEAGLIFYNRFFDDLWEVSLLEYPQYGKEINLKFEEFIETLPNDLLGNFRGSLQVKPSQSFKSHLVFPNKNFAFDKVKVDELAPKPEDATVEAIASRLKQGIKPKPSNIKTAIVDAPDADSFRKLCDIARENAREVRAVDPVLESKVRLKQQFIVQRNMSFPSILENILNSKSEDRFNFKELTKLLSDGVKVNAFTLCDRILSIIVERELIPKDEFEACKFVYLLTKFYFRKHDFKTVVRILENIRTDPNFMVNPFFIQTLTNLTEKSANYYYRQLAELEYEDETIREIESDIYSKLPQYTVEVTKELDERYRSRRDEVLERVDGQLKVIKEWVITDHEKALNNYKQNKPESCDSDQDPNAKKFTHF